MKKLLTLILILSLCIAATSCSKDNNAESDNPTNNNVATNKPTGTAEPSSTDKSEPSPADKEGPSADKGEPLRVLIVPFYHKSKESGLEDEIEKDETALAYLNDELIPFEGLNIEFKMGPSKEWTKSNSWKFLSAEPETLRDHFDQGYVLLGDYHTLSQLYFAERAQDLSIYRGMAPTVFDRFIRNNRIIPVKNEVGALGIDHPPNDLPAYQNRYAYGLSEFAVYIKSNVYESYRKDTNKLITSIDEYEAFLDWVVENRSDLTPVITYPGYENNSINPSCIFNLFFPKYGYAPLSHNFYTTLGYALFTDMNTGTLCQLNEIPEPVLTDFVKDIKRWQSKYTLLRGKIDGLLEGTSKAASVLAMTQHDLYINEFSLLHQPGILTVNPSDYHVFTLNSGLLPQNDVGSYTYHIMAKEGVDLSNLFIFLEWLNTDVSFYTKMMYGEEGVDYEWSPEGKMIKLETENKYNQDNLFKQRFRIASMESKARKNSFPPNYQDYLNSMKYVDVPGFRDILIRAESLDHVELYNRITSLVVVETINAVQAIVNNRESTAKSVERLMRPTKLGEIIDLLSEWDD